MNLIKLSSSKAERWTKCTGSIQLEPKYPKPSGKAAIEGSKAHKIAYQALLGTEIPDNIDFEMKDAVRLYVDTILQFKHLQHSYEKKIDMVLSPKILLSGTPDVYMIDTSKKIIRVIDFKYGFGPVEVFKNWQLVVYLYLITCEFLRQSISPSNKSIYNYEAIIVQPRAIHKDGPIRKWEFSNKELKSYITVIKNIAHELNEDFYRYECGKWCRYCNALHACTMATKEAGRAMDISSEAFDFNLTPEQLSKELNHTEDALQILTHRWHALEEYATDQLKNGSILQGWELRSGVGRLSWKSSVSSQELIRMGDTVGINLKKPDEVITPRQAKNAGLSSSILKHYTCIKEGFVKLKKINMDEVQRLFSNKRTE